MIEGLPDTLFERAQMLQNILIDRATGGSPDEAAYVLLRKDFVLDPVLKSLSPDFVRTCRDLGQFWGHIKDAAGTYQERRQIIWNSFAKLLDHLEMSDRSPADTITTDAITILNSDDIASIWQKALARRTLDPDGAITTGRQLLESVCKHILDDTGVSYKGNEELPKLFRLCAEQLNLSPSQFAEQEFKAVLGGCQTIVQNIGAIRNKFGDAHGLGRSGPKPAPRHAALVVNLAGTMASFLMETFQARQTQR